MKVSKAEYIELIEHARCGDDRAMSALVARFQDVAVGLAYSWLGDIDLAREVAQDAFLEAHLNLHRLNDPAAFPAWFRQIVIKYCDRVTRRLSPNRGLLQDRGDQVGPEALAATEQEREHLRMAVAALSPEQRQVVALQYFAELTGNEIADFLQIPLSTVKKRLRLARKSLHEDAEKLMKETMKALRPSNTDRFSEHIQFFIALRACDETTVTTMLKRRPELANAEQDWDSAITYQRVLPFASKATALITAIELDELTLATALLDAGADPNGTCGCATGEPPLWAATLLNRISHVRLLLDRGADPNVASAAGNSPLHVAAMRGYTGIARLLVAAGASTTLLDSGEVPAIPLVARTSGRQTRRTPADWAHLNGHGRLASELGGTALPAGDAARQTGAARIVDGTQTPMLETGIKAVDFFCPLSLGSLVRLHFGAGVGMLLLVSELIKRFSAMPDASIVWSGFAQPPFDLKQFEAEMAEFGLSDRVEPHITDYNEAPEVRRAAFERGLQRIAALTAHGNHTLAVLLNTEGFENDVEAALPGLGSKTGQGSVTTLVVTPFRREAPPEAPIPPFDVHIALDRRRSLQQLYPAIDPGHSFSAGDFTDSQARLRERVRQVYQAYETQDPTLEKLYVSASGTPQGTAENLLSFFSQPFKVVEPFGGLAAEYVPASTMLQQVETILDGNTGRLSTDGQPAVKR